MAYPRGQSKIVMNPAARNVDEMFRIVATPSFFVALTPQESGALLALPGNEERLAHVYDNAMSLWSGQDFCEIEDTWDPIHRIVNRHPPVAPFEWDIGSVPQKYLIMGTSQLLEDCTTYELTQALAGMERDAFFAGYQVHCPRSWDNFGEADCRRCWDMFIKLRGFFAHHADRGKNLVFAVEY